jgi:hypothetical protein
VFRRSSENLFNTAAVTRLVVGLASAAALLALTGCGSSHRAQPPATSTSGGGATTPSTSTGGPGALQAEANATAAGDIPDNQVFLVFRNGAAGYSMKYPEGWAQQGSGKHVTFRDKNNIVRIVVGSGAAPTKADVGRLTGASVQSGPQAMTLTHAKAYKVVYSTESAPNAVTGKRVKLVVDRYYVWKPGRLAVVDLGTPEGVDNVDAYRLMIESFRWS